MQRINKVAQITLLFWIMKIIATTLGETLGDFFSITLNLGYLTTLVAMPALFIVVLIIQLSVKKYIPAFYRPVIIGTQIVTSSGNEKQYSFPCMGIQTDF